jgi:YqcI/YcgG family
MPEAPSPQTDQLGYDPARVESLRRFADIQNGTECIFASAAAMWGCQAYDDRLSLTGNLRERLPLFTLFCRVSGDLKIDGLVLELPGQFGEGVETLGRTTLQVLDYLSANDPLGARCMKKNVEDPTWWFSFAGAKLFILTFGPCYPVSNSRYGFETVNTYLVFQPIHAFSRHLPDGDVGKSQRSREEIRRRYANAGRPYDLAITLSPYEVHRYVKPLHAGQPPVSWWRKAD